MQGWLFKNDASFWTKPRAKALLTSVPLVGSPNLIITIKLTRWLKLSSSGTNADLGLASRTWWRVSEIWIFLWAAVHLLLPAQLRRHPRHVRHNHQRRSGILTNVLHQSNNDNLVLIFQTVIGGRNYPNTTMVGTGLTMEGINQNYVAYDIMLEMGWRGEAPDLNQWYHNEWTNTNETH